MVLDHMPLFEVLLCDFKLKVLLLFVQATTDNRAVAINETSF